MIVPLFSVESAPFICWIILYVPLATHYVFVMWFQMSDLLCCVIYVFTVSCFIMTSKDCMHANVQEEEGAVYMFCTMYINCQTVIVGGSEGRWDKFSLVSTHVCLPVRNGLVNEVEFLGLITQTG